MTVAMMSKCTLEKKTSSCSLVEPLALDGAVWCEILRTRTRESLHVKRQEKSVSRILGIIFPGRERRHQQQRGCKEVLSARLLGFGPGGRAQFARLSSPRRGLGEAARSGALRCSPHLGPRATLQPRSSAAAAAAVSESLCCRAPLADRAAAPVPALPHVPAPRETGWCADRAP